MNIKSAIQTFLDTKEILDQAGIKFWLVDGTALGAVRDGGFIPYDTDIDLRVLSIDWDFSLMFRKFRDIGFRCKKSINPKLYEDKPSGAVFHGRGIRVDICSIYHYPPEDLSICLAGRPVAGITVHPARLFRGDYFVEFLGIKARVPNPPEEYLNLHYGEDWKIPAKAKRWKGNTRISLAKYVEYFHAHPEINQHKERNSV